MSSWPNGVRNADIKQTNPLSRERKKNKFKFPIPNSDIFLEKEIEFLEDLNEQDLLEWVEKIKEICSLFQWTNEVAYQVLKASISDELNKLVKNSTNISNCVEELLSVTYNQTVLEELYRKAQTIKQNYFFLIERYGKEIEKVVRKISCCKQWSKNKAREKAEEMFFLGLANETRLELSRTNTVNMFDIIRSIKKTEDLLIKVWKDENESRSCSHIRRREPRKWCDFHRCESRDTNQCKRLWKHDFERKNYAHTRRNDNKNGDKTNQYYEKGYFRKRNLNYNKNNYRKFDRQSESKMNSADENNTKPGFKSRKETNSYSVMESKEVIEPISLKGRVKTQDIKCLIDSGSQLSYIEERLVDELNLEVKEIPIRKINMANLQQDVIDREAVVPLQLNGIPSALFMLNAGVMKRLGTNIILGVDFLSRFNCVLDFKTSLVRIQNNELEFPIKTERYETPDTRLLEKTKIYSLLTQEENKKLNEIVLEAKDLNPELGLARNEEYKIEVRNPIPFGSKGYKIPIAWEQKTWSELFKLEKKGVIRRSQSSFISPCFPVLKHNGTIRLFVDYRRLNTMTTKDTYPIPEMKDQLLKLRNSSIFSTLDLNAGYYQVALSEESMKYTAFVIGGQVFEFT